MPTSLRPPSSTGRAMMPCCSISRIAAPASASGVVLFGVRVMTSRTGMSRKWSVRSMSRVRSPAVTTPTRLPAASTTATVPRFSASSTTHSRIGRAGWSIGTSRASITSATRSSKLRPNVPPGCSAANCSRRNPLTSSRVTARASPRASAAVVLAVGASVSGQASSVTLTSRTTSDWRASAESGSPVSAMIGTPSRLSWFMRANSSSDPPLFESRMATSSLPTSPRSPCSESTGWRNEAGLPVEVSVAAILRAISPDLPTPETISRPVAFSSSRTAAEKAGPRRSATRRIASASRTSTRRPRSASSVGSVRDIATLQEVFREQALPLTPGLEDQLSHLAHCRLAAGERRDDPGSRFRFRHRVRDCDGEAHAREQGQIGQVVAHERGFLPGDAPALEQGREGGQLLIVLDQLVYLELARAQLGGVGAPGARPHHHQPCRAEHADAEAVLDVKALEFDRVIADHPDVDAIVRQDAVDVEADELQAAGGGSVEHGHFRARAGGTALARSSTTALPPPWDLAAAVPPARAACQTSSATLTIPGSSSNGIMFGPSDGARSGSGCVSRKKPSAPAAAAAYSSGGMKSRRPPLEPSGPCPGCCTTCVPSYTTGAPQALRSRAKLRMSTTRSP